MTKSKNRRPVKPKQNSQPKPDRYFFFYRSSSPFSNFHLAPFVDEEGNSFFCSEQYMMYHKAILFGDLDAAEKIMKERNEPRTCKRLGRLVANFDDQVWKANARRIVEEGVYLKFTQNPSLKSALLSTKDREMVEAAPSDRIWGIGYNEKKALQVPRSSWGSNWLGQVLMVVRERIKREDLEQKESPREEGSSQNARSNGKNCSGGGSEPASAYVPPAARKAGGGGGGGAVAVGGAAGEKSKSALRREKQRLAKEKAEREAIAAEEHRKVEERARAEVNEADPEKRAKKIKKTLKQIDDIKKKREGGGELNDDQRRKVASEEGLRKELASLGL